MPMGWQLQNIQAGLNVCICATSALATYCFVRFSWQTGTKGIRLNGHTRLSSLLTINTVGEAIDAFRLLRARILGRQHILLLMQCVLVLVFATTTLLAGPIARYSTRMNPKTSIKDTPVYPAMKEFDIIAYANDYWTDISRSLDEAGYPRDRLLDFLPDTKANWTYVPDQWTRTWSLQCDTVPRRPIQMTSTGNCTGETAPWKYEMLPELYTVLNISNYELSNDEWSGFWLTNRNPVQDMLLFIYADLFTDVEPDTNIVYGMNFSIASVHLHELYKNLIDPEICQYAAGPIGSASYARIDCALTRERHVADEHMIPFPDTINMDILARALNQNFQARFMTQAATNRTITEVTPEDLIRFYQVYMISKDTQYRQAVPRQLSVTLQVPQLSVAFLTVALLVIILSIWASSTWCVFILMHRGASDVPQTKLDWLLQAVQPETLSGASTGLIKSRTYESRPQLTREMSSQEKFESAAYVMDIGQARRWPTMSQRATWKQVPTSSNPTQEQKASSIVSGLSDEVPSVRLDLDEEGKELYPRETWPH